MPEAPQSSGKSGIEEEAKDVSIADRKEEVRSVGEIESYFSAASYRKGQRETLVEVDQAFRDGYRYVLLDSPTGPQPLSAKILTPVGWTTMGEVDIGDEVITFDGTSTRVLSVEERGKQDVYEIVTTSGAKTRCGANHLWTVSTRQDGELITTVRSVQQMLRTKLRRKKSGHTYRLPTLGPVAFESQDLPIASYTLGALIGDGCYTVKARRVLFTAHSSSKEIVVRMSRDLEKSGSEIRERYRTSSGIIQYDLPSRIRDILVSLEIYGQRSEEKRIPKIYLFGSVEQRISLLRGLMDTDGYVSKRGNRVAFFSISKMLVNQVLEIVRSFGGTGTIRWQKNSPKGFASEKGGYWQVCFSVDLCPFYMLRKRLRWESRVGKRKRRNQRNSIYTISLLDKKEKMKCIVVEHSSGLYVTDDYIVTHNSGKSQIAMAFARQAEDCHILTVQKILQNQYDHDFSNEVAIMKGRGTYRCIHSLEGGYVSCAKGVCRRKKRVSHADCPYKVAMSIARDAQITVHNFDSFYFQNKGFAFNTRDLLVVDEAHNVENKFLNFVSFTVSNRKDPSLSIPKLHSVKDYTDFLKQYEATVESEILVYDNLAEEAILTTDQLKRLNDLQDLYSKLQMYFNALDTIEYVFDYREYKEGHKSVMFRPVYVRDFVLKTLFPYGNRVLMMSATILDKKIFCKSVGLDPDSVYYISTPSYFSAENRPIYKKYAGSMSYKDIASTLPKMLDAIRGILAKHSARRGIIHTANERVASYIQNNLFDTRLTFRREYRTVDDMLAAHRAKSNSFIVASGLKEGLDLYDDLSRVQVLAKIPYPDLSDKRVQRRKELEKDWYGYQTVLLFVQSLGRSIRSETDRAITYILDENFERFYKWNKKFIPHYVREAIKK